MKSLQFSRKSNLLMALVLAAAFCLFSCTDDEPTASASFLQIYDDSNYDLSYDPIDVVEVIDGFVILAGTEQTDSDFDGIRLLKTDEEGNFQFSAEQPVSGFEAPVGDMHFDATDSSFYFFAKSTGTLNAALLQVNTQLELVNSALVGGNNYPLSSVFTDDQTLLLQSYNPLDLTTELAEISLAGAVLNEASFSIGPGDDVEEEIIDHFLETGKQALPFLCGKSGSEYYFNGFYNYNFSLVFSNFGEPSKVVQGLSSDAGIRAVLPLGTGDFAVAGYQYDNNYQLPSNPLSVGSAVDLYPGNMAEIKPYAPVKIISYTLGGTTYAAFASETKSNQIVIHFYDQNSGELAGIYYLGYLNPFSLASIKAGANESLLVLGTTFVAGRFERIMLNKISAKEIENLLR